MKGICELCSKPAKWKNGSRCNYCCVKIRRARIKLAAVNLLGGVCQICGWNKDPYVLEFHHKDDNKEFGLAQKMNISWEKMKTEALKCELLCSNCHQQKHSTRHDPKFHAAVIDYKGELDLGEFGRQL